MVRSADPVTNHSFDGSNAIDLTHPMCPEITALSSQGACHFGEGTLSASEDFMRLRALLFSFDSLWEKMISDCQNCLNKVYKKENTLEGSTATWCCSVAGVWLVEYVSNLVSDIALSVISSTIKDNWKNKCCLINMMSNLLQASIALVCPIFDNRAPSPSVLNCKSCRTCIWDKLIAKLLWNSSLFSGRNMSRNSTK